MELGLPAALQSGARSQGVGARRQAGVEGHFVVELVACPPLPPAHKCAGTDSVNAQHM